MPAKRGCPGCHAELAARWRVQAESFLEHLQRVGERAQVVCGRGPASEDRVEFVFEPPPGICVTGEQVETPEQCARAGFVRGEQQRENLVPHLGGAERAPGPLVGGQ